MQTGSSVLINWPIDISSPGCTNADRLTCAPAVANALHGAQAVSENDISEMDFPGIQGGQESSRAGYNQVRGLG